MRNDVLLMTALVILALTAGLIMPGHVMAQSPGPDFDAVDQFVQREMDATRIPGLALAILHEDRIVHLKGFGIADPSGRPVTPQTPFNIGSLSKTLTALSVLQLAEAGRLELRAPVQRYLPWFQVADPDASAQMTVADLLNHTSGLPTSAGNDYALKNDTSDSALEKRVRALRTVQPDRAVGTGFEYSNANYDTLGLIVQVLSGQPYESYVQHNIFAPLEMKHSFTSRADAQRFGAAAGYRMWLGFPFPFAETAPRAQLPSGQQYSSAEDLAHLFSAYLNGGRYQGVPVLSEAGIQRMQNSPVASGAGCATYSMHWSHSSRCDSSALWLGGDTANFKARVQAWPDEKWAVVVLMNTQAVWINGPRVDGIDDAVLALLQGKSPPVTARHNTPILGGMIFIAVVTAMLVVGMVRSILRLRRLDMRGFPRLGLHIILPLGLEILWVFVLAGILYMTGGQSSRYPLAFMLENAPDAAWMIISSAVFALVWGTIRTVWTYRIFVGSRQDGAPGTPRSSRSPAMARMD